MQGLNEAIKLAIEKGGYKTPFLKANPNAEIDELIEDGHFKREENNIILDPLFWQALGKALGWANGRIYKFNSPARIVQRVNPRMSYNVPAHIVTRRTRRNENAWKHYAHQYLEIKLTGGDEEKFWLELLKKE